MKDTQKHRHFVAIPIALVGIALVTALHAVLPVSAIKADVASESLTMIHGLSQIDTPSGTHLSMDETAEFGVSRDGTSIHIEMGDGLFTVQGYAEVKIGCVRVQALRSIFYVSHFDTSLTVASVEGPLLVRLCSAVPRIVSEGFQLTTAHDGTAVILPVASSWIRQQAERARLAESAPQTDVSRQGTLVSRLDHSNALASHLRSPSTISNDDLHTAFSVTRAIDPDGFLPTLFAFALLPSASMLDPSQQDDILQVMQSSPSLALDLLQGIPTTLLQHPAVLPDSVHTFWLDGALRLSSDDPALALSLLRDISHLGSVFDAQELPKQADLWRQNIIEVSRVLDSLLSESDREILASVRLQISSPLSEPSTNLTSSASSSSSTVLPSVLAPKDMLSRTQEVLHRFGVLFTSDTRLVLDPHDASSIRVTEIFVSDQGRDTAYELSYSPSENLLHHIVRDGSALPNALSPEQFFHAMKKASE